MKTLYLWLLSPLIIFLFGLALLYYFFTKNDLWVEVVNDVFEGLWT